LEGGVRRQVVLVLPLRGLLASGDVLAGGVYRSLHFFLLLLAT
jgi:hypothetical protein